MKKHLLLLLSLSILSFSGYAQCTTTVTPTISIAMNSILCVSGISSTFISMAVSGQGTNPTYSLFCNGTLVQNNVTFIENTLCQFQLPLQFYPSFLFQIKMTSNDPCATTTMVSSNYTQPQQVILTPLIVPTTSPTICASSSYTFGASILIGTSTNFQWYLNGSPISGAIGSNYTATQSGSYTVNNSTFCPSLPVTLITVNCTSFDNSITGSSSITAGQQNVSYSVPNQSGFTYSWIASGGTIQSGQGTNAITVNWGNTVTSTDSITLIETNQANQTSQIVLHVTAALTTSIKTIVSESGILLYPNPASEFFSLQIPETGVPVTYTIYDISGTNVQQGTFTSSSEAEKINTSFTPGLYQVVVNYNNVSNTIRLNKVQ